MALRLEDRDLVLAYQAGDDEAFAELVREYRPQLLGHARRKLGCPEAAEDAVQEALVRALRAMPRFNGNYLVGPWLHRILSNVCSDEGNRLRREGEKTERFASNDRALNPPSSIEDELGLDLDDSELADAVDNLSEQYREALMLRFVEELSYEEVAAAAGVSEENARARVSRARNAVRAALKLAAAAPVALIGLLRRGERAAAAVTSQSSPGSGRAALHSAMPMLAETAPMATRAAAATANAATVGVPVVAKAAVGFGLATAVIAPTVDSPVHKAADRVLPDSVMEVLTPLAVELPAPDAPVIVPAAAPVTGVADVVDPAGSEAPVEAAAPAAAAAPVVEAAPQESEATATVAAVAATPVIDDSQASEAAADGADEIIETSVATQVVIQPDTEVSASGSVQGAELTFTPSGADRYDVAGSLSLTVTTVTTSTVDGVETSETITSTESVAVISPSTASLDAADPAVDERRFSALLVFAPGDDGMSAEMRLAARGTANDDGSLAMTGFFTATGTESLPLAERGNLSGTLTLDAEGMPAALSITLTQ
ncbi:MAG: sigma-70 family RNA polymerase sigma factor [Acidimicrobiales bacterium]|nr:sigma-70 family RNA polymerase sigma factor [Acidimicrobiales bacterium]MYD84361.1 sigma-70 family RNA polymerase sigma factor [Acidimicrobiales bacterium]MYJ65538.1 sigma-70 family RNA polymerase sigma factor [Acidimicrobiales bacterium]